MITLITGDAGIGKTNYIVNMILENGDYAYFIDKDGLKKRRPLFVNGIPELKIEHQEISDEQIKKQALQDFLPYGSLVVIDDAERFISDSTNFEVPKFFEYLSTSKLHYLNIFLVISNPKLILNSIKPLISRHLHIQKNFFIRKIYEWPYFVSDVNSNLKNAISRNFKLSKKAFNLY